MLDAVILLHIAVAILAQFLAILATCVSTLFLFQQRNLKRKRVSALFNQPLSLEFLDLLFTRLLRFGFVFISISVVSGFFLFFLLRTQIKAMELKILWSLLVWVWYSISLLFRHKILKSRTISAQMCSIGFLILLSACFGFIF